MDFWTLLLSAATAALAIYFFFFRDCNTFKKAGVPHVPPVPIFGNMAPAIFRRVSMAELVNRFYKLDKKAKYVGMYDIGMPIVLIRDLEMIKSIGVKNFENFPDHRSFIDEKLEPLFGKNLASLHGEVWKDMRTLLSPAFTSSKMRAMFKLMSECAENFAEYWANEPPESNCAETKDAFARYTNDVIATCAFGIKVDSVRDRNNEFYKLGRETAVLTPLQSLIFFFSRCFPRLSKLLGIRLFPRKSMYFFTELVDSTIRTRDEKGITRPDMIQLMMESRGKRGDKELTIEDMTAQAFVFFLAGFDSTSTLMSFAAHEIAVNPGIQKRLQAEIDDVWKETNGELVYEALNEMKYLDAVINEALRVYPVAVFTDRLCRQNFELPPTLPDVKPFTVQKGTCVWFPIYGLHMDPDYFSEPEKFNPDRFLDENKQDVNLSAFLPFGLGPRICIGNRFALMETKVMLFHLLARCDLQPCEKTPNPLVLSKKTFTMVPEGGFWLSIKPRSSLSKNSRPLINSHSDPH